MAIITRFVGILWLDYLSQLHAALRDIGYTKLFVTSASVLLVYRVAYALYFSPLRNVPGPFLARLTKRRADVLGSIGKQALKAREESELYGDVYIYQPNAVSISSISDIRTIFGSHSFRKGDFYKGIDSLGFQNLVSARDPQLATLKRRQMGPYFNQTYLGKMEGTITRLGILAIKEKWDRLIDASTSGATEVNYQKDIQYATFDTIGALVLGRDFGALKNDDPTITKWLSSIFTYVGVKTFFPLLDVFPFSLLLLPLQRPYDDYVAYGNARLDERKKFLEDLSKSGTPGAKPVDLLQAYIDAEDPESKIRMTHEEIMPEALTTLFVGSDTTANTLILTTHLLMLHPEYYKRAVSEVRSAFAADHLISFHEAKSQLPFIEACIYESLRFFPATGGQWPRIAPKGGVTLSGHFIPEGTEIYANLSGCNLNNNSWHEPHRFDPIRFLDNEEAKRNVLTFGSGVRICPGRHLAWIEMMTILANILKDYDLQLPDDYTRRGPSILDERGYPQMIETEHFFTSSPKYPLRDCRLHISKHK
ncbi:cytochrome P450 [Martensiomyces pterosporus]|nr:cytochrome P450 [Martensiomyces pterosporus]